jgi:acyl-CoA thioesterase-2
MSESDNTDPVSRLVQLLDLEPIEINLFRGVSPAGLWQRVFGGQVVAQALVAAQRTVDVDRQAHSLHGYFMRPGDPSIPIIYEVGRLRDGGSFTTRRVTAIQKGEAIFALESSFQKEEEGLEHFIEMPDVPAPETLPSRQQLADNPDIDVPEVVRAFWRADRPIDMRPVDLDHYTTEKKLPPRANVWFRASGKLPDDRLIQRAVLAYASDMTLLDTALYPHGKAVYHSSIQAASLDHALWFHRPFNLEEWHLYTQDSPNSSGGRGLSRGSIYDRDGRLVASVAQEGLIRLRRTRAT